MWQCEPGQVRLNTNWKEEAKFSYFKNINKNDKIITENTKHKHEHKHTMKYCQTRQEKRNFSHSDEMQNSLR